MGEAKRRGNFEHRKATSKKYIRLDKALLLKVIQVLYDADKLECNLLLEELIAEVWKGDGEIIKISGDIFCRVFEKYTELTKMTVTTDEYLLHDENCDLRVACVHGIKMQDYDKIAYYS